MTGIPKAQRNFVNYFIEQDFLNATEAYRKAYPKASDESARREASRLLSKVDVQVLISQTISEILAKDKIPLEKRIFDYWMKRAFYDITEIISIDGKMKLSDKQLREKGLEVCIDSINKKINAQGKTIIEYKFADKDKAVDMLQRYIQMVKEPRKEIEVTGTLETTMTPEERHKRIDELLSKVRTSEMVIKSD
jgi:phage terminase small subunit